MEGPGIACHYLVDILTLILLVIIKQFLYEKFNLFYCILKIKKIVIVKSK